VWFSRTSPAPDGRRLGTDYATSEESLDRSRLNYPDFLVFDLDSYLYSGKEKRGEEPALHRRGFEQVRAVVHELRSLAEAIGLTVYVKTSGRTGLHLYLPILRRFTFDDARGMAQTIGSHLAGRRPKDVTLEWTVAKRRGKVFFDYNQNVRGKSLAAPYSPRRHAAGTVSMPLHWDELDTVYPTDFTIRNAAERADERGDPWADMLESKADLGAVIEAAAERAV
jgi:bifunctional non-homologous end joining protein LigD